MSTVATKSSRREFLKGLAGDYVESRQEALAAKGLPAPTPSLATHAANRLMYGPRPGDVQYIENLGYSAYLEEQLNPLALDDSDCDARLAVTGIGTYSETRQQLYDRRNIDYDQSILPITQVRHAAFVRALHSRRQLLERVVEFWHNHFNIYGWDFIIRSMWSDWDKTLRQHALGNFRQMLEATAAHPCMLLYLDNYISTAGGPNENYAREAMELHTLGAMNYQVEGGYIDQDVYETSRCFTGWTFEQSGSSPTRGDFKYNHDQHDRFIKYIFGQLFQGDRPALDDGRKVLDLLAYHPGTARHVAWKLAVRFVGDNPSAELVQSTADVFFQHRFATDQIAQTLRHLLSSGEFLNARMTKFKRPFDWTVSAMRALGIDYTTDGSFYWLYDPMGQQMFSWRTPDGPPDTREHWLTSNNMLRRWNWAMIIASNWYDDQGLLIDPSVMPAEYLTARQIAQFWADRVLQRPASQDTLESLIEFVADGRGWDSPLSASQREDKARFIAALCLMTPEFMRR